MDADSKLSDALAAPEAVVLSLDSGIDASSVPGLSLKPGTTLDLDTVRSAYQAGLVTRDQLVSAASALEESLGQTASTVMGARGNSGVITSQILRGIAEGLCDAKDQSAPSPADIAHGITSVDLLRAEGGQ